ncbi:MAG: hypothetical protein KAT53_02675 [Dehalococcoidia bacterium]|nr:hypothetical protein [Dehalococcoidia bacterium]
MARMGQLTICVGPWSLVVPFSLDGLEVATKFLELLDKMAAEVVKGDYE